MATVGQALTAPEAGWQRIDDTNANITYVGTWFTEENASLWNSIIHGTSTKGDSFQFNFTGTKLRIIGNRNTNKTTSADVYIDGVVVGTINQYGSRLFQPLEFDISNLSNLEHYVSVVNNATGGYGGYFSLDAIDIDSASEIKPYNPSDPITIGAQTNLTATAGDTKVILNWDAITDATGYNVKRSTTAGGPYTTIATNVSTNSYVDTDVVNGTTYYYVVTAVTADGESDNSNEASATPAAPPIDVKPALLRVTVIDSSEREYQLTTTEIDGFITWFNNHTSSDTTSYMLAKKIGLQSSEEYLAFDKIVSFEVIPVSN